MTRLLQAVQNSDGYVVVRADLMYAFATNKAGEFKYRYHLAHKINYKSRVARPLFGAGRLSLEQALIPQAINALRRIMDLA